MNGGVEMVHNARPQLEPLDATGGCKVVRSGKKRLEILQIDLLEVCEGNTTLTPGVVTDGGREVVRERGGAPM